MLELMKLEDRVNDEAGLKTLNKEFILIFTDDKCKNGIWPLLEKELKKYNPPRKRGIWAETLTKGNKKCIKLHVPCKESHLNIYEEIVDDDLEIIKEDFRSYYKNVIGKYNVFTEEGSRSD